MVDRRDATTWVVLELTRSGELRVEEGTLEAALREIPGFKDIPMFVPATTYVRNGHRVTVQLMQGYVFIASGLPEVAYFELERESPHLKRVLSATGSGGLPTLSVISNTDVEEMRAKLQAEVASDLHVGMEVQVNQGPYKGLEGQVVSLVGGKDEAQVLIRLRSLQVIRSIPRVFLEPAAEAPDDP